MGGTLTQLSFSKLLPIITTQHVVDRMNHKGMDVRNRTERMWLRTPDPRRGYEEFVFKNNGIA